MDPLLELLRFGTAILAGGLVAVIAQRLAFDHARRLQREEGAMRDAALRRALVNEMRENMRRIGGPEPSKPPAAALQRSAWDAARALPLDQGAFEGVADAYAVADAVNSMSDLIHRRASARGIVKSAEVEATIAVMASSAIRVEAGNAYELFRVALGLFGEAAPEPAAREDNAPVEF